MSVTLKTGPEGLWENLAKERSVEIRCTAGCGKLVFKTSRGAIDSRRLEIRCQKCDKSLRPGDWQVVPEKAPVCIFVYRCDGCNLVYEKIFHGIEKLCKGCKISRIMFIATSADPPMIIADRSMS